MNASDTSSVRLRFSLKKLSCSVAAPEGGIDPGIPAKALELCALPPPAPAPPTPFAEVLSLSLRPPATPMSAPRSPVAAIDPTGDPWACGGVSTGDPSRGKGVVKQLLCCESLRVPIPDKHLARRKNKIRSTQPSKRARPSIHLGVPQHWVSQRLVSEATPQGQTYDHARPAVYLYTPHARAVVSVDRSLAVSILAHRSRWHLLSAVLPIPISRQNNRDAMISNPLYILSWRTHHNTQSEAPFPLQSPSATLALRARQKQSKSGKIHNKCRENRPGL